MHRRSFFMLMAGSLAVALPAQAAFSDDVVAQLTQQGFQNISVSTTWLGRIRIIAYRDGGTREIVLNPRTGEILRDLWTTADGAVRGASIVDDVDSGSGNGSGSGSVSGSDDNGGSDSSDGGSGSDDDQADDDKDDNSGSGSSGSGSSGSGSGGSGSGKDDAEDDSGDDSNDDKGGDRSGKDN